MDASGRGSTQRRRDHGLPPGHVTLLDSSSQLIMIPVAIHTIASQAFNREV